ncbi:CAP domain [Plasmopara halstedii]|uniref:CAP domain n=1 Tax=Plasmopara halstedii TaxID=4781 RepID=A0A0P1APR2_PLAHL|nr:CAP domain [Plasmopara halstedii]CEG43260.1 CAP domain [Plasmopara halstedii]|eukprot:XP_024579629.1 CAP domain [Plasmopara halstedii]
MVFVQSPLALLTLIAATSKVNAVEYETHYGAASKTSVAAYTSYEQYATIMLVAVNKQRATQGLPPMCLNKKLHDSAQLHSDEMAAGNYLGHQGSQGSTVSDRITQANYKWNAVAENVASGQSNVEDVMVSWINSPGHLVNIMGEYTMFAPGYTFRMDTEDQHFWTQDFGSSDIEQCDGTSGSTNSTQSVEQVQTDQEPEGSVDHVSMYPTPEVVDTSAPDCHSNF